MNDDRPWWEPTGPRSTPEGVVREVRPEELVALRRAVLRNGRTDPPSEHPDDHRVTSLHLGLEDPDGGVIGGVTVVVNPLPGFATLHLVLMAVDPGHRRRGIGRLLVEQVQEHARAAGLSVWAAARVTALGFYVDLGFRPIGDDFVGRMDLPHRRVLWSPGVTAAGAARSGPSRRAGSGER